MDLLPDFPCSLHLLVPVVPYIAIAISVDLLPDFPCSLHLLVDVIPYIAIAISVIFNIANEMSRVVRKPDFCICENKDADQLRGNREADQRLCFRYMDGTIPLLPKSEISSLQPSSVAVHLGLCRTWSETPKTAFLTTRLKYKS